MSSQTSVELVDKFEFVSVCALAAVHAGQAIGSITVELVEAIDNRLEAIKNARLARERLEKAKQEAILSKVNSLLEKQDFINQQNSEQNSVSNLANLEASTAKIRDKMLKDLASVRREFDKVDFSGQLSNVSAESKDIQDRRVDVASHSLDELLSLQSRLSLLDPVEAKRLHDLIVDIKPDQTGRLDALAYQLKISISRAASILAKEIFYRDELESMRLDLEKERADPSFVREFSRQIASCGSIDKETFDKLTKIYERYQTFNVVKKAIPGLDVLNIDHIDEQSLNFTSDDFLSAVSLLFMRQGYDFYDEKGNKISKISKKCFAGLDFGPDYQAMIKISAEGKINFQLVRVVIDEKDLAITSEYQRQKDREVTKKWCTYCKDLTQNLKKLGINANFNEIKDENSELLVIVNENLSDNQNLVSKIKEKEKSSAKYIVL
jgi:hypothetical protein